VPLTALPGVVRSPTFSPDGNHVAFTWNGPRQDNSDVYVLQIGAGAPLRLTTDAATDYSPAWSPDGRAIAFLRERPDPEPHELRLVPPLGGPERKVAGIRPRGFLRPVTMAWCPDSSCLVVTDSEDHTRPDALVVVSVESGDKRPLTTPQHPIFADTDPAVSPDGGWLAFRRDAAPYSGQLQVARLGDGPRLIGEPRSITPAILGAYGPDWISNREIAFWAKGALWRTGTSEGSVPERLPFGEDGITVAVSRSRPGRPARLAYVRSYADTNIWEVRTSGEEGAVASPPVVAISSTRREGTPQLAPDGRRVAFISDRSGEMEIWVAERSGANPVQLTSMGAVPGFPRWSPDGETIAFHANPEGQGDIFVVPASGGRVRQVTSGPENEAFPSFSRDGRWIYFSTSRGGTPSIWKTPVSAGHVVQVSTAGALQAIESPDGANLYYVTGTAPGDAGRLWRLPLRGGEPVGLVDGVLATGFDVLDEGVYYLEPVSGETRLRHLDFATGRATTVADRLGRVVFGLTASRDGRSVLYSRVDTSIEDLMLVEGFR
jgi:Tol biopolymer transport system component